MNELPIFLSYRQDDGSDLGRWLHDSLQGRTMSARDGALEVPKTLSVYFDQSTSPVSDWQSHLKRELERARVLLVICSPGAATEFPDDFFYLEIRWWIENRSGSPPILITPSGQKWIPAPIKQLWPMAQTIDLSFNDRLTLDLGIHRILDGIASRVREVYVEDGSIALPGEHRDVPGLNLPGLFTWEKDKDFRYIACNENYARAAGFDSPHAMIGKSDDDMPWRSLAPYFRQGDQSVMNAEAPARKFVHEKEIMVDREADILVTESQLVTQNGACVGVTGFFLDITGTHLVPVPLLNAPEAEFRLGPEFGDQSFTSVEANVFKGLLSRFPAGWIASELGIAKAEVEAHTSTIMHKLQCRTLGDVIATAIRSGLPYSLFGPKLTR